jgi:hypothetical protein
MSLRDLSLPDWARMSDEVAQRECEALARSLPHGLRFDALVMHEYGGRCQRVAGFSRGDIGDLVQFVLVPGGEVSLGFDGRDFRPSAQQIASFAESANAYDLGWSIHSFVDSQTSARRGASVAPMLIEVEARPVERRQDAELLSPGDPTFDNVRRPSTTAPYVAKRLAETGMRLPTCDEMRAAAGQRRCFAGAMTARRTSTPPTPVRRIAISRQCGRCRWASSPTSARPRNGTGMRGRTCSG